MNQLSLTSTLLAVFFIVTLNPLFSDTDRPPPFEKIYVGLYDIQTTPEGIFYLSPSGKKEKVRKISTDCYGTYIIKFQYECPSCGKFYDGNHPDEGFDCPLVEKEVLPHIWCK